jgi:hypothetical protein
MILPSASKSARLMRLNLTLTIRKNNRHYSAKNSGRRQFFTAAPLSAISHKKAKSCIATRLRYREFLALRKEVRQFKN